MQTPPTISEFPKTTALVPWFGSNRSPCHDCLLEHAAAGDDIVTELAVELSQAKLTIDRLTAQLTELRK